MAPTLAVLGLFKFVFSRRFSIKGKMPDLFSFLLQTTIRTLIGPLFTILSRAPEAKSAQGKLYSKGSPLSFFIFSRKHTNRTCPKGPPFGFFSALCDFFSDFFLSPKGPPFIFYFFNVTYKTGRASRVPPLDFFSALCDFFSKIFYVPKGSPL